MNLENDFANNDKRNSSSDIELENGIQPNFSNINCENEKDSPSISNVNNYTHNLSPGNDQIRKTKKRRNSKVFKSKNISSEKNIKLQKFNTSISLPMENNLLESRTFYSDFENEKLDINSDFNEENARSNDSSSSQNQENPNASSLENSQSSNDITDHKKWKKIFSKMFFYENKTQNSKECNESNLEDANKNESTETKELYVLMNKKETKKLMKMKSDSKYNKCDTLSVLSCTKGNIVKKFKNSVFQGIPDALRGTIWQTIIDPFHSFCIKLSPEIASLMNTYNTNKEISNHSNLTRNEHSILADREVADEADDESLNSTSSCFSYANFISSTNTNVNSFSNSNSSEAGNSHSIKYVKVKVHSNPNLIQFLSSHASQRIVDSIEGDIGRTLIQFEKMRNPNTQQSLKKILAAYSVIDGDLGYSQGMAFIAAMLLLYMDERASFNCFCNIMLSKRFGFRNLYVDNFSRVSLMNKVWNVALQNYFPHIQRKLNQSKIDPIVYTMGWWLANFLNFPLPNDVLLLLFDRCLLFGSSSLISFGLTILGVCHEYLENSSIDEMIALLQMPSNYPKMHNSKEVIYQWNTNFWISKKTYAKILKKANVSFLP